jgi:very-short-patch-repair endonuclease
MQQNDLSKLRARAFPKELTAAEATLWFAPRDPRFMGLKFRKHVPLGPYIADFSCPEIKLVIAADGDSHAIGRDLLRDRGLEEQGFRVLRLSSREVLGNLDGCLQWLSATVRP